MKIKQSAKLEAAIHYITAAVLLIKGFDKLSTGFNFSGIVIFTLGIIILLITIFVKYLNISHIRARWLVYVIEAIALMIIAILYFQEKKVLLPYFYLVPSLVFFVLAGITMKKDNKTSHDHG